MSDDQPTSQDRIRSFHLSAEDEARIRTGLAALGSIEGLNQFSVENQIASYMDFTDAETSAFRCFWISMEAGDPDVAWSIISKLYTSPAMKDETRGPLALCCEAVSVKDAHKASIVDQATPLSKVALNDWAYYLAIARLKNRVGQHTEARKWVQLAQLVPQHHTAFVTQELFRTVGYIAAQSTSGARVLPRLLTDSETIISTFSDADKFREVVPALLERVKADPSSFTQIRDENMYLHRLAARASRQYHANGWYLLAQPEAQTGSIWSTLPDAVIRVMANVVDWSQYLKLASTCKQYHNRMNHPSVWLSVLEGKYGLDVTILNADIPKNPVLLVQQVHALTGLSLDNWKLPIPTTPPSDMLGRAFFGKPRLVMNRFGDVPPSEVAITTFKALITADRTGDLVAHLIEECAFLHYLLNAVKSNTNHSVVILAVECLTLLYLRSRRTCVLVSRFLPPPMAWALNVTAPLDAGQGGSTVPTFASLNAAASVSYILYPSAHDLPKPMPKDVAVTADPHMQVRESDFCPELVHPRLAAHDWNWQGCADGWGKHGEEKMLNARLAQFNMNEIKFGSKRDEVEEAMAEAEALQGALDAPENLQDSSLLHRFLTVQELDEDKQVQAEMDEVSKNDNPEDFDEPLLQEDVVAKNCREIDRKRADECRAALAGEWQLFLSFKADGQSLVHRGILRMKPIEIGDEEDDIERFIFGVEESNGFWTIGPEETCESILEAAAARSGAYGSQHEAQAAAKLYTKSWWNETHSFTTEDLTVSFDSAMLNSKFTAHLGRTGSVAESATPKRSKSKKNGRQSSKPQAEEHLFLSGAPFEFGHCGSLISLIDEDHPVVVGGFLLIKKQDSTLDNGSMMLTDDLKAFERLAQLPLQHGPLADVSLKPHQWAGEEEFELLEELTSCVAVFNGTASNTNSVVRMAQFLHGVGWNAESFSFLYFPDPKREEPLGPLKPLREQYATTALKDVSYIRAQLLKRCFHEEMAPLQQVLDPVANMMTTLGQCPNLFNPYYAREHPDALNLGPNWDICTKWLFTWVARLRLSELCGVHPTYAMPLLIHTMYVLING